MDVEQELLNASSSLVMGLLGSGFLLAWISEAVFSLVGLFTQWCIKKIKGDKSEHV